MKPACSISARPTSTGWCCTPITRRGTSTIRQTPSAAGTPAEDHNFFQAIIGAVADAGAVLITGPANAKHELVKHIDQHNPKLMKIIAGVETVDHPSDAPTRRLRPALFQGRGSDAAAEGLGERRCGQTEYVGECVGMG